MNGLLGKLMGAPMEKEDAIYALFRFGVSLLFLFHGAQKILAAFGGVGGSGAAVPLGSLYWWAGIIELVAGALIALGIFTRLFALIAAIEMAVAYFMVHWTQGINPLLNGGELAVLFFLSFLLIAKHGANSWSLERVVREKEIF